MINITRPFVIAAVSFLTVCCSHVAAKSSALPNTGSPSGNMGAPLISECITQDDVAGASTKLPSNLQQGQHVIGYVIPKSRVIYNGQELRVKGDGALEFDIPVNAPQILKLQVTPPGQLQGTVEAWVSPATKTTEPTNRLQSTELASGWPPAIQSCTG